MNKPIKDRAISPIGSDHDSSRYVISTGSKSTVKLVKNTYNCQAER